MNAFQERLGDNVRRLSRLAPFYDGQLFTQPSNVGVQNNTFAYRRAQTTRHTEYFF